MAIGGSALWLAVLAGLMGMPHCAGMCGGFVSSIALRAQHSPLRAVLAYNAGRVTTYIATGSVMGLAGLVLDGAGKFAGVQGAASMIGGVLILLWRFQRYALPLFSGFLPHHPKLHRQLARLGERWESAGAYLTGLLLGLLPCGLTYAMYMHAAATGSGVQGALVLLSFGLATFPVMLLTALSARSLSRKWRQTMHVFGGWLVCLMGVLAILKGASVNGWIPGIHPWLW